MLLKKYKNGKGPFVSKKEARDMAKRLGKAAGYRNAGELIHR